MDDPNLISPNYMHAKTQGDQKTRQYLNLQLSCLRREEKTCVLPQVVYKVKRIDNNSNQYILISFPLEKQDGLEIINKYKQENEISFYSIQKQQELKIKQCQFVTIMMNNLEKQNDVVHFIKLEVKKQENIVLNPGDRLIQQSFQKNYFKYYKQLIFDLCFNKNYLRKKQMLILGEQPQFQNERQLDQDSRDALNMLNQKFSKTLNQDQFEVIKLCLLAKDFALIQGYPGTGKTYTIAHLLYLLGSIKKKVLVCTYTHSAVDNLLEKFKKEFNQEAANWIVRLAPIKENVSHTAQTYHFDFSCYNDFLDVRQFLESKLLYFTTCLSVNEALKLQKFDYCIVEEASQIIEPLCISCILKCKVFILIGDYKQLQPLIRSKEAEKLKISLLERLDQQFKDVKCSQSLTIQYRMNEEIMKIANKLIYNNQLKLCKKYQNQGQKLKQLSHIPTKFEKQLHNENQSVLFLDTNRTKDEIENACAVIIFLLQNGLELQQLLIITTYNKMVDQLQNELKNQQFVKKLQITTIDKSQGKEGDCILVVCSEVEEEKDHLLENIQRCNVACTRAKKKFIMIGNSNYLSQKDKIKDLIQIFKEQDKIFEVDEGFKKKYIWK